MKKYLSMILIVALLISSVPISAAADESPLFTYSVNYSGYASFEDFIVAQSLPLKVDNFSTGKTLYINKADYDKYGLVVYGNEKIINYDSLPVGYPHENSSAEEIYNDKKTGTTGYRYLGYSASGEVVTNAYYPPDAPLSDKNKWIEEYSDVKGAPASWQVVKDGNLREYMTAHWIGGNGINTNPNDINTQYTVETINNTRSMGALNAYPIDGVTDSYKRTLLLTAGGWYTNFSVRTERGKYYQTWIGDGMASNARVDQWLTLNLQNNDIAVTMASDQQFVEVNTSYTAVIVPDNQYMKKEHVKQFEASISKDGSVIDSAEAAFSVLRKTVNRTVRINRSELVVGTQEVEISGSYVLDTIFKNDPKKSGNLTRKVIVTVEEPAVPTASCLVTANPRYKTSSGSDVDVSITADISLYKVTTANVANIAVWLDGECQYASVINPTVTFHRTIDGAPFADNPDKKIKQPWNVTVDVTLKDGRVLEASGDDMTVVVGEPKPPEVKVNAPKTAKVGDTKGITVRGSSVTGALDYLILNDGSTDIAVEHPTDGYLNKQYEFTREGEQTFTGVAIDTLGYSGYGEDTTMVLPPTVDAVIHTEGQLKPYRKITVSSMQSDSPDKFPIVDSQTDWWVSSGTVNAASGVYSPADPDGSRKFDFGVPTAGTINTSVTLKNTLGYEGQASKIITITPDEPPEAALSVVNKVYRDPSNSNTATISVLNESTSKDGDAIGSIQVSYWYDHDGDNRFDDEVQHIAYWGAPKRNADGSENKDYSFNVSSVGKYYVALSVAETYTPMPGMESSAVYLYDSTYDGSVNQNHIVEVDNIPPSTAVTVKAPKHINLKLQTGNSGLSPEMLTAYINGSLTTQLKSENIFIDSFEIVNQPVGYEMVSSQGLSTDSLYGVSAPLGYTTGYSNKVYMTVGDYPEEFLLGCKITNLDTGQVITPSHWCPANFFNYGDSPVYSVNDMLAYTSSIYSYPASEHAVTSYNDMITQNPDASIFYMQKYYFYYKRDYSITAYALVEITKDFQIKWHKVQDFDLTYDDQSRPWIAAYKDMPDSVLYYFQGYYHAYNVKTGQDTIVSYQDDNINASNIVQGSQFVNHAPQNTMNITIDEGAAYPVEDKNGDTDYYAPFYMNYDHMLAPANVGTFCVSTGSWAGTHNQYIEFNYVERAEQNYIYLRQLFDAGVWAYNVQTKNYFYTNTKNQLEKLSENTYYVLLGSDDFSYISANESNQLANLITQKQLITTNQSDKLGSALRMSQYTELGNALINLQDQGSAEAETILVTVGDPLSIASLYHDYENDARYDFRADIVHTDPYYYENSMGVSGYHNTQFRGDEIIFDKVGKYDMDFYVRDNPVGKNDALDKYRYWSRDKMHQTVLVHRKPVADFYYNWNPQAFEDLSYDYDHKSDPDRGIKQIEVQYRLNSEPWQPGILPTGYAGISGTYMRLRAKDVEGVWSDWTEKTIATPPPQHYLLSITADLQSSNAGNPLTAFRPGNYVQWYNINVRDSGRFQPEHRLEIRLLESNGLPVENVPMMVVDDYSKISGNFYDWNWQPQDFYIPDVVGLENKTYQMEIAMVSTITGERHYVRKDITLYANDPPSLSASLAATALYQGRDNVVYLNVSDPNLDNLSLSVEVKKDGEVYLSKSYMKSYPYDTTTLTLPNLETGNYAVTATVNDGAATATQILVFTVIPNTPPAVAVNVASLYLFETDTNTAFVSVYDAEGDDLALDVTVLKDGTVYRTFSYNKTSPYTDEVITLNNLSAGTYTVRAFAADDYGNATATATFPVYVNSPPYITAEIAFPEVLDGDSNTLTTHLTDIDPQNLFVQTELYKEGVLYSRQNTTVAPVGGIYSDVLFTFPNLPIGSYLGQVAAWDGYATSNYVNYSFNVIPRNLPPSVTVGVTPETLYAGQKATVAMLFDDGDHEPLTVTLTVIKDGTTYDVSTFPVAWLGTQYEMIKKSYDNLPEGTYTAKAVVSDGTATDEDVKTFIVQPLHISDFEITGAWNHWDGRTDYRGIYLTPNAHRFLSLETVTFHASVQGLPETVAVMLSPELMAMTYTDPYGVVYEYEELVGYDVSFPLALSMVSYDEASAMSNWEGTYLLPLAPSTLSWEDIRKRSPYEAELTASQELSSVKASIDDVEITGNIYDRISLQPVY
ncbi:hypothetical protein KHM83_04750 [Fusibacter paucivorans]|uniref:Uncharacterized protein n=1 Tax=Fusibacter paucivorans TaxID=76009 RepID=A0ABS5PM60_9FIRM|nr:hypothetical protein [Fusibacter paucivorans]MBS7525987.1 hypothetical protein [Fusibacter paucivorans]